jgi:hypothetical protein
MQIAAGARKQSSSCGCGGFCCCWPSLHTIPPHQPRSVSAVKQGRTAGKWKAALGMAHLRSPLFAVQARNQSWKDQAPLLLS